MQQIKFGLMPISQQLDSRQPNSNNLNLNLNLNPTIRNLNDRIQIQIQPHTNMGANLLENSPPSGNQSSMGQYSNGSGGSVASFLSRLMGLSAHELQCLDADHELARQLNETKSLLERRLQHLASSKGHLEANHRLQQQQQQQPQPQQHHHDQQHQAQMQLSQQQQPQAYAGYYAALSAAYYQNQLALGSQQHQLALDLRTSPAPSHLLHLASLAGQQHHLYQGPGGTSEAPSYPASCSSLASSPASEAPASACGALSQLAAVAGEQQPARSPATERPPVAAKKYKGEFDEPSPAEVERRQRQLYRHQDNYHRVALASEGGVSCACTLGSEFDGKSAHEVLLMIDRWRQLDPEERNKTKWDVGDLPKEIPLSEIKRYEELRHEASGGRADFGGASKRKPLGIRGTRQFLLILYCLWGHPGREDPMQKEGYCPHCFAKIKKANEQSTLVRVVNHFNMKHRHGANPRISPNRETISPSVLPAGSMPTKRPASASSPLDASPESHRLTGSRAAHAEHPAQEGEPLAKRLAAEPLGDERPDGKTVGQCEGQDYANFGGSSVKHIKTEAQKPGCLASDAIS